MKKPILEFKNWYQWERRNEIPNCEFPGVYCIAISERNLEKKKFDYKDISYIGMTISVGGLRSRLQQFNRSIKKGKRGHSGANTMRKEKGLLDVWEEKLYVVAFPVICSTKKQNRNHQDLIKMGWVAFLEYEAMANCKKESGLEPPYNKK